jgi:hypothetical protein
LKLGRRRTRKDGFAARPRCLGGLSMTIRGGGDPDPSDGFQAVLKIGPAARSFAADAHGCIMPDSHRSTEYKLVAR